MITVSEKAYAKINISLDVLGRREDGYHEMLMIMQSVSLCDDITVTVTDKPVFCGESNLRFIPTDERNLAVSAARVFCERAGITDKGAVVRMDKRIPVGAGMAGGSSDAAAVLRSMNRACGEPFSRAELELIAADIGSDVAFCVSGGTRLASGRGEKLEALPAFPECHIAICKPDFSISTPELFKKLDSVKLRCHPDTAGIIAALSDGDLGRICRRMYNVFEDVQDRRMNTVSEIKNVMLDKGALGAVMTGTGSAVFGIFDDGDKAAHAIRELRASYRCCCLAKNQPELP